MDTATLKRALAAHLRGPTGVGLLIDRPCDQPVEPLVRQAAEKAGIQFRAYDLQSAGAESLRGVPGQDRTRTRWSPPEALQVDGQGILFLENLQGDIGRDVRAAALSLVADRRAEPFFVPDGWFCWASTCSEEFALPDSHNNRMLHLHWNP
jgi:hypothetical protein